VTVIVYDPAGVVEEVVSVSVDVQVGLQDAAEKPTVVPEG